MGLVWAVDGDLDSDLTTLDLLAFPVRDVSVAHQLTESHPRTRSWLPTSHMISLRKSSRNSSLLMSHPPPRSPSAQSPASWSRSFKPATNPARDVDSVSSLWPLRRCNKRPSLR